MPVISATSRSPRVAHEQLGSSISTARIKSTATAEVVVFGVGRTGEASFSIFAFGALLLMALRLGRLDLVFFISTSYHLNSVVERASTDAADFSSHCSLLFCHDSSDYATGGNNICSLDLFCCFMSFLLCSLSSTFLRLGLRFLSRLLRASSSPPAGLSDWVFRR